ncbi:polysaccharide pyruvyl transferase family protein [Bacillus sp. FJAT-53711]|uniref:Polysaccharide pyruvyl transferase family protein n=1 Tax=Bacillus yunxiaonensis TaxID=3127665 RepID=A0ABU8FV48_9BACI
MKKVMVYAYTHHNLGDDLFIKILCERYPKVKFILYAPNRYKSCFKNIKNISIIPSDLLIFRGINYIFRKLKVNRFFVRELIANKCDAMVYIGGSLFIQGEDWKEGIENVKSMQIKSKPFFLLGANFGPFKEKEFYLAYKEIFKGYTDVCFREKYSYDMFNDLNNVRMADDIIFQLEREGSQQPKNSIVISVIKPSIRKHLKNYDEIYYEKIKDIATYFIEKGYEITLMSFCESEGDLEAVEKIMNRIPKEYLSNVTTYLYELNIREALSIIEKSSFVVATRFHSMILGWVYNKPVFPIVYSEKMTNVMRDVDFKGAYTEFNNIDSLNPEEVFKSMETNLIDVSNQIDNAKRHFEKLDEYLL